MNIRPLCHAVVTAAFCAGLALAPAQAFAPAERAPIAPTVTVLTLKPVELVETQVLTGTLVPREEVLVVPEIEGLRVTEILVEDGDTVQAGQVLARLSKDTLNAQVDQWQATMNVSTAQIAQARSQIAQVEAALAQTGPALARAQDLLKISSGTQATVEQRTAEHQGNQAKLTSAKDGLTLAIAERANREAVGNELKVKLGRTDIRAPVGGLISRRTARLGAIASGQGDALFRIIANGEVELEAEAPEPNLPKLAKGQPAQVTIAAGLSINGLVRLVSSEVDKSTRMGKIRIGLPVDKRIHIGSFGRGVIEISRRTSIAVPVAALQYDGVQPFAQVVWQDHVVTHKVAPGLQTQGMVEILQGLAEGDVIIARARRLPA